MSSESERRHQEYLKNVSSDEKRKLSSRRHQPGRIWSGLTFFGMVGWTVAVPTVLGAALGAWLDRRYPIGHSWTVSLLVAGLTFGCFNAWRWLSEEEARITTPEEGTDDAP
ncbi:MAG: AtpZ/AtpI family protein [Vulcanimicrobiota bacterium]